MSAAMENNLFLDLTAELCATAASVALPVALPVALDLTTETPVVKPYLAHSEGDRAKRNDVLRKETQQYTPDKTVEAYRARILEFKAMMRTVFKEENDTAQIIHIYKVLDFLYYQCYRDQRKDRAAETRKRRKDKIQVKIEAKGTKLSKKEIAKIRAKEQVAKRKRQLEDLYGSDMSSATAELFDETDYYYVLAHKSSKLKEGAIPNPVGHTSFKNYYNAIIKLLNYQVHTKKNNSACRYDDKKGMKASNNI